MSNQTGRKQVKNEFYRIRVTFLYVLLTTIAVLLLLFLIVSIVAGVRGKTIQKLKNEAVSTVPNVSVSVSESVPQESGTAAGVGKNIATPNTYIVNTESGSLNVHEKKSEESEVVTSIPKGTRIKVIYNEGNWGYVSYNDNNGWVNMSYLKEDSVSSNY